MKINKYLEKIKAAGVQSYYGSFCYSRNIAAHEALTNKTPNVEFIQWITEKHRIFQQEKLMHNRVYNKEEQKKFFRWLKEEAVKESHSCLI